MNLPLIVETKHQPMFADWNATETNYPRHLCVHQLFEQQVERTPDAIAVVFEDTQLTYRTLNNRANQLAHYLRKRGVEPGVLVGIYVKRSLEMVVGFLSILKAGGAYVPLDLSYPAKRLAFMLEDAQVPILLTQHNLLPQLPEYSAEIICFDKDSADFLNQDTKNPYNAVKPSHLAYVIYTSGSTGKPKGILIPHRAIVRLVFNTNYIDLNSNDKVAQASNASFDAATFEIWGALLHGAQLIGLKREVVLSPTALAVYCETQKINVLFLTTALFNQIVRERPAIFKSMRYVLFGGEAVEPQWVAQVLKHGPPQHLLHVYGPTENTTFSTSYLVKKVPENALTLPIGHPISNTQLFILDSHLQPTPCEAVGEIYLSGDGLASGYLNCPALTTEKFIPNPFNSNSQARLYKTGDLARYLPNGDIEYLGRIDHQVKIRGFRIELPEIEIALAQHPEISKAIVVAKESNLGNKRLIAYIVPKPERLVSLPTRFSKQLKGYLKEKLPEYMIPAFFVVLEKLPLTPNGKIDRDALPAPVLTDKTEAFDDLPQTAMESQLCELWKAILNIKDIGIHDDFFELGGHSLLAIQLLMRLRDTFQVDLSFHDLFEYATIAQLAKRIELGDQPADALHPAIQPIDIEQHVIPLSFAQQQLWLIAQLVPKVPVYNEPVTLYLSGHLNIAALEQSLQALLNRHTVLRSTFKKKSEKPVQTILPLIPFKLSFIDLQSLSDSQQTIKAKQLATEEARRSFDITQDLPIRAMLIQLGKNTYRLHLTLHHIVFDGVSFNTILLPELQTIYKALSTGHPIPLTPPSLQYIDFAYWQRQHAQNILSTAQLTYWQTQLAGLPLLKLPLAHSAAKRSTFKGAMYRFTLPLALSQALKRLSRQAGVTLFTTLLAAFQVLLHRYTGQTDIPVGTIANIRHHPALEQVCGLFLNTLVLRTDLSGNPNFRTLLKRLQAVTLAAYKHQDFPFEKIVEKLQPERGLGFNPLFQVMFTLNPPLPISELGWQVEYFDIHTGTAKFDLTLELDDRATGIVGRLEYSTDLFDQATILQLAEHWQTVLQGIVDQPEQPISHLPLLTPQEQQALLHHPATNFSQPDCLHHWFERQAAHTPTAIAVVFEAQKLTYQVLNQRANQLAHYLKQMGVEPNALVGLCVERTLDMVIGILGILKVGGAYVPLDPHYPENRLTWLLTDAQVSLLITQEKFVNKLAPAQIKLICFDQENWMQYPQDNPNSAVTPDHLAYVIYTSGSTGQPKGVLIGHSNVTRLFAATAAWFHFDATDVWTLFHSYAFDFSVWELWGALLYGGRLVIVPHWISRAPENFHALLATEQVTILNQTPSAFYQLMRVESTEKLKLRWVVFGGEALELQQLKPWFERYGDQMPRLVNMYGITETTVHVTYRPLTLADVTVDQGSVIGIPIPDLKVYLFDQYLQLVPMGVAGELYVGGAGLAQGYLNRPQLTAERFIANPYCPQERLYKTGDLARYLPNGDIEYLGRVDHQVKIRGFRVELGEIETTLMQHPKVQAAIVISWQDSHADKRLVTYVVGCSEQPLTSGELRRFLKTRLPDYMIPAIFMMLEALPLTAHGKLDRHALPAPEQVRQEPEETFVAPRDALEQKLAKIWEETLDIQPIGIHDNFFDLGGHSLLAVALLDHIEKHLGKSLALISLFQAPTIAQLAQLFHKEAYTSSQQALEIIQPQGSNFPLFFIGSTSYARSLAPLLGRNQPIYGLNIFGLPCNIIQDSAFTLDIKQIARQYIQEIQTIQPEGPYYLCAYCADAKVAFEMAQQLVAQQQQVAFLAFIDVIWEEQEQYYRRHWNNLRRFGLSYLIHKVRNRVHYTYLMLKLSYSEWATKVHQRLQKQTSQKLQHMALINTFYQAVDRYNPQPYPGRLTLLFASEWGLKHLTELSALAKGGLEVYEIPGYHENLFLSPQVEILAKHLKYCIDKTTEA